MTASPGPLAVRYEATVDLAHHFESPARIEEVPVARLAPEVLPFIYPSRYIPARFVTGIDYGAPPSMGPPDFHAYVEVFLGSRWYLFDATGISPPMGLVRIGTGRDAADVSFATMFGAVKSFAPTIAIDAVDDAAGGFTLPGHSTDAVSTHGDQAFVQALA